MTNKRIKNIVILADGEKESIRAEATRLQKAVEKLAKVAHVSLDFSESLDDVQADLAIVLGGDGSILQAVHQMQRNQLPVLGVNHGKLGFMADVLPEQLDEILPIVCQGNFRVVEHLMFECQVLRDGQVVAKSMGLNEVAVLAGSPFTILEVQLYVDAELATIYSCDGLIVSTPIGSTAHSLSAGGPILRTDLQAFVIVPISPHTLTNRPVVDSADRVYELSVPNPNESTSLVVDGQVLCKLSADDRVRIVRSESCFRRVEVAGKGYYRTLREKLGWGGRLER